MRKMTVISDSENRRRFSTTCVISFGCRCQL